MCTGNLSEPKPVPFPGLDRFRGEWVQTNRWPHREVALKDRRVAIVGTGSSGVQAVPVVAQEAARLHVFQRTPHYAVPARNARSDVERQRMISRDLANFREAMLARPTLPWGQEDRKLAARYTPEEQRARMERQWAFGGHGMAYVSKTSGPTGRRTRSPPPSSARRSASGWRTRPPRRSSVRIIRSARGG
jgi:cation diffusion facilitator CzcD-associated flavoprotein CzcO